MFHMELWYKKFACAEIQISGFWEEENRNFVVALFTDINFLKILQKTSHAIKINHWLKVALNFDNQGNWERFSGFRFWYLLGTKISISNIGIGWLIKLLETSLIPLHFYFFITTFLVELNVSANLVLAMNLSKAFIFFEKQLILNWNHGNVIFRVMIWRKKCDSRL